ncbi:MAG TPA: sensor domain-containing diguanylate cyclase [Nitrococcus sp.]|nr:sensor domain-containing diguanylate cyclase [Nitrococcus sp.]
MHELVKVHSGNGVTHRIICHINPVCYGEDGTKVVVVDLRDLCRQADVARGLDLAQTLTECAPVGVAIVRIPDWRVLYTNYAYGAMIGAGCNALSGKSMTEWFERPRDPMRLMELLMNCDGFHNMEVPLVHRDGERIWTLVSGNRAVYQGVTAGMLVFNKINEHRQLRELASYDALTGLPNRNQLWEQLWLAMTHASRTGQLVGVLFVDLDGFKQVNDRYGHQSGDRLLTILARRLSRAVRGYDTVARIGGDEFVILLDRLAEPAQAEQVARHILNTLSEPVELAGGCTINVSASIGIAIYPIDGDTGEDLLQYSDLAMYRAKRAGPGRIQLNTPIACMAQKGRTGLA